MTATLTATGIRCGKCSTFQKPAYHATVADVRACHLGNGAPVAAPVAKAPVAKAADVPAGRYAVDHEGVLKFYHVDRPTEGKWKGYTFLKVQASDDLHAIKNRQYREAILAAIAQDPAAASKRYGMELGKCGVCGRTLTDEISRANGIDPICADKSGW